MVLFTCAVVVVRLSEYPSYFAQLNATTYLVRFFAMLGLYVSAILFAGKVKGMFGIGVLRVALICGYASGLLELLAIAAEMMLFPFRVPRLLALLSVFTTWTIASFWATVAFKSIKAGLLTSVVSAGVCMLIGVAGGAAIEMLLAPTDPAVVATWQEFKRSAWTDPAAFQIANTLGSAFSHLLLASVVAMVVGTIASGSGKLLLLSKTRHMS